MLGKEEKQPGTCRGAWCHPARVGKGARAHRWGIGAAVWGDAGEPHTPAAAWEPHRGPVRAGHPHLCRRLRVSGMPQRSPSSLHVCTSAFPPIYPPANPPPHFSFFSPKPHSPNTYLKQFVGKILMGFANLPKSQESFEHPHSPNNNYLPRICDGFDPFVTNSITSESYWEVEG